MNHRAEAHGFALCSQRTPDKPLVVGRRCRREAQAMEQNCGRDSPRAQIGHLQIWVRVSWPPPQLEFGLGRLSCPSQSELELGLVSLLLLRRSKFVKPRFRVCHAGTIRVIAPIGFFLADIINLYDLIWPVKRIGNRAQALPMPPKIYKCLR